VKELDVCSERLPGDVEDDMLGRIEQVKRGTTRRSPRRSRTAKAFPCEYSHSPTEMRTQFSPAPSPGG
jgi:hypothetical protein